MGCGASSSIRLKVGDVVCSRADRTRTGKVEECDGSSNPFRVRWDDTGHLSNWLAALDVVALSEDEVCQREVKYGAVLAQREEQQRRKREEEEAKKREREEKRKRIGGVGAVVCSLANRSRTGKVEVYDGSVSPYTVRWDDTDDLSGGLTLEDVDAISDEEQQQREAKYATIFAQREEERKRKEEEMKKLEEERKMREEEERRKQEEERKRKEEERKKQEEERKMREEEERRKQEEERKKREEEARKKQEDEERKKREEEEKERAKHELFQAASTGELSEMTRLLARPDAPDLLKHRFSVERWSGVERNVPTDRLLQGGWKLHMAAPYSKATKSRDLDPGKGEWLCMAARKAGTDVLVVAAMAKREDVLRTTSSSTEAIESNGVFWYHWPAKACGFSGHEKLNVKPEPKAGMTVTTTSDLRGAPSGKTALLFSKGSRKTIVELKEENGEFYATETEYGGSLWFPLSSTDFYSVVGQIGYGDQEHTNGEYRLSWCLDGNGGGYRAGKIKDLEKSGEYEKVVFYSKFDEIEGTALHGAAGCSKSGGEAVSLLLDIGGRELLDAPDSAGRTAREIAAARKHSVVVAEIDRWTQQRAAWEQEMQHRDARNASFIAAGRDGQLSSLKTLLAMNADVYAKDSEGSTALHRAAEGGHGDVAAWLLQEGGQRLAAMLTGRGQTARDVAVKVWGVQGSSVFSIIDSAMCALDSAALQAHTDVEALNAHEHAFLATYVEEQTQLRTTAAALLEKGRVTREQHTRLLEEQRRQLEAVERPLRVVNDELDEALAKMYALKKENQLQLDSLRGRHESLLAAYTAAYSSATQPLTPGEYAQLLHSILLSKSPQGDVGLKFLSDVRKLVIGEFEHAAGGFSEILGWDEDTLNVQVARGLPAMAAEVEAIGDPVLTMWWDYVVHQAASEKLFPIGVRDKGRAGIRIEGFAELDEAQIANLNIPELIALRLYSTPAFPFLNDPLRAIKDAPKAPKGEKIKNKKHPLAVIVMLLIRAIKKLRKVDASADEATQRKILWRGMKNVEVTSEFEQKGGTELGAMSTTTDLDVAFNYCRSSRSLIFKIVTENKLQRGASVQWISAFPNESEVLFSPLTFMQATGKNQVVEMDGYHITIVEVRVTTA